MIQSYLKQAVESGSVAYNVTYGCYFPQTFFVSKSTTCFERDNV